LSFRIILIVTSILILVLAWWLLVGALAIGTPRLPGPALDALAGYVSTARGEDPGVLRLLEIRRIGPDIAVIYRTGRNPGAALLSGGREEWAVVAEAGGAHALAPAAGAVGHTQLVANDLLVVFVAFRRPQVGQIMLRFPDDGTVLKAPRHGNFAILWRPAAELPAGFVMETYDRRGRALPR
jgi:hypothetical protein